MSHKKLIRKRRVSHLIILCGEVGAWGDVFGWYPVPIWKSLPSILRNTKLTKKTQKNLKHKCWAQESCAGISDPHPTVLWVWCLQMQTMKVLPEVKLVSRSLERAQCRPVLIGTLDFRGHQTSLLGYNSLHPQYLTSISLSSSPQDPGSLLIPHLCHL